MENNNIAKNYTEYYSKKDYLNIFPTEFVVRIFLAEYPNLNFKKPVINDKILDIGFGDGRNTLFLCKLGLDVHGIEISQNIIDNTSRRLNKHGYNPTLNLGKNNFIPYPDNFFDYILASFSIYYCEHGTSLDDNLNEYSRVLKPGGRIVANFADANSYIFKKAKNLGNNLYEIRSDPYKTRNGYNLVAFSEKSELELIINPYFTDLSIGHGSNDYFGIHEKSFWLTGTNSYIE
jgi:ubiquinone/menaquinone biosynthesis C-methylase UbiE